MKTLTALGVALALAVSSIGIASKAQAEPKRNTDNYYVVGLDERSLVLMSGDVEDHAGLKDAWLFGYLAKPVSLENNVTMQATWMLVSFNCTAGTVRVVTSDVLNEKAEVVGQGNSTDAEAVTPGSAFGNAWAQTCGQKSNAVLLTKMQAAALLQTYVAKGGKLK